MSVICIARIFAAGLHSVVVLNGDDLFLDIILNIQTTTP